ncbi:penicillin-binding protein activator LpoB [Stieleria maiorica]|nr:penicillin-binding protein activator LpoB [Stieleria maiorica]
MQQTTPMRPTATAASVVVIVAILTAAAGCAGRQYGHLLANDDKDLVGSHAAGAATWNPLVEESVAKLLSRCPPTVQPVTFAAHSGQPVQGLNGPELSTADGLPVDPAVAHQTLTAAPANVCFVGIENKSAEELGDFKEQLYEQIDSQINSNGDFRGISRRMVQTALRETRLRPDALFLPANREAFAAVLGKAGTPVDYLLFANITTGTTDRNKTSQRDYTLTLEMVNVHTGDFLKESAKIRKGYSKSRAGKWWNYGIFDQADG